MARRIHLRQLHDVQSYARFVRENPHEAVTLMQEDIDWNELPKGSQGRQAIAVGRQPQEDIQMLADLRMPIGALSKVI